MRNMLLALVGLAGIAIAAASYLSMPPARALNEGARNAEAVDRARAAAGFADPDAGIDDGLRATLITLFDGIGAALTRGDGEAAVAPVDYRAMLDETLTRFPELKLGARMREQIGSGLKTRQATQQAGFSEVFNWQRSEIRRVERLSEGRLLVYARHFSETLGVTYFRRWWLLPGEDGWRIYDAEIVEVGMRESTGLAFGLLAAQSKSPEQHEFWKSLGAMMAAFTGGEVGTTRRALTRIDLAKLPDEFAALMGFFHAVIAAAVREHAEALRASAAAKTRARGPMPQLLLLDANQLNLLGRHAEALALTERFVSLLGPSEEALSEKG